jgi:protein arginine kinase
MTDVLGSVLERPAGWVDGSGQDSDIVLMSQCKLYRNLADYPFPQNCSDGDKEHIENRVLNVLENTSMFISGHYVSFPKQEKERAAVLFERGLTSADLLDIDGPRGVYFDESQQVGVSINEMNHVMIQSQLSGFDLNGSWHLANGVDDALSSILDFSFDDRLGYLTYGLRDTGTALRAKVILHLPACVSMRGISALKDHVSEKRHELKPLYGQGDSSLGDLYVLSNASTLGQSEDEMLFYLRQLSQEIIDRERESQKRLFSTAKLRMEDRVERALGLARHAKILAFDEAISVLSSLRLGVSNGLLETITLHQLNEALLNAQDAHLAMRVGHPCDEVELGKERADWFRIRFAT